jgi:copper transporter 1
MLSVMTKSVGYFMSVLYGIFLGSLAVGRYGSMDETVLHG